MFSRRKKLTQTPNERGETMIVSQYIAWGWGSRSCSVQGFGGTPEKLLSEMIANLIEHDADTFKPRVKWWQFWLEWQPEAIVAEYVKQTAA